MKIRVMAMLLCGTIFYVALAGAEEAKPAADVEATVAKAMDSYKAGKTAEAIAGLQDAITLMQKSLQKGMAAFFPKAPESWEAGEIKSSSMSMNSGDGGGSYTNLTREYTHKDGRRVEIAMTNAPQLVEAQKSVAQMYRNPEFIKMANANDPNTKITVFDRDGWTGWTEVRTDGHVQAIVFASGTMLSVQSDKGDEGLLNVFLGGMDLKGLAGMKAGKQTAK